MNYLDAKNLQSFFFLQISQIYARGARMVQIDNKRFMNPHKLIFRQLLFN